MKYFKHLLIMIALISLYGVALRYPLTIDCNTSTLSSTTRSLLAGFDEPVAITLKTHDIDMAHHVQALIEKYQRVNAKIAYQWQQDPSNTLVIENPDHQETIYLNEGIAEALLTKALFQFKQKRNQWVVFLQGHDEPSLFQDSAHDLSLFRLALENQGFQTKELNLQQTPLIPDNVFVLVIASPKTRFLPTEEALILDYLSKGKNVLWLTSPAAFQPTILKDYLGVEILPGKIHDNYGQKLGTPNPNIAIVSEFPKLPFPAPKSLCAFPDATALHVHAKKFNVTPFLKTNEETSIANGRLKGPFTIGLLFTPMAETPQRITVIGNTRFLTNGVIQNYGNLALGLNLIHWLNHNDIAVVQPVVENQIIHLSSLRAFLIQYGFPCLGVGMLLFSIGFFVYRNRLS